MNRNKEMIEELEGSLKSYAADESEKIRISDEIMRKIKPRKDHSTGKILIFLLILISAEFAILNFYTFNFEPGVLNEALSQSMEPFSYIFEPATACLEDTIEELSGSATAYPVPIVPPAIILIVFFIFAMQYHHGVTGKAHK